MDVVPFSDRHSKFADYTKEHKLQRFYCPLPSGESMAQMCTRLRAGIISTLHRNLDNESAIIVSHGDVMRGLRVILERISAHRFHAEESNRGIFQKINNCQIIHYTRVDPENPEHVLPYLGWMRSICPWDTNRSSNSWQPIVRRRHSNRELLELARQFPRVVSR